MVELKLRIMELKVRQIYSSMKGKLFEYLSFLARDGIVVLERVFGIKSDIGLFEFVAAVLEVEGDQAGCSTFNVSLLLW